jgi:hypothetical protein
MLRQNELKLDVLMLIADLDKVLIINVEIL